MNMCVRDSVGAIVSFGLLLSACSGDPGPGLSRRYPSRGSSADPPTAPGNPAPPAPGPSATTVACPADVPTPASISVEKDAADLYLVADRVYFRVGTTLFSTDKSGGNRTTAHTNAGLVAAFVDADVIVALESTTPPNAEVRIIPRAGTALGTEAVFPTGWDASATTIFASDAQSFYVLVNGANADTIYGLSKTTPGLMYVVASVEGVVTSPQVAGASVWFVRDNQRVYKADVADPNDPTKALGGLGQPGLASEVFGSSAACALAVGSAHAFCSTGPSLEQRDLSGGNPRTLLEVQKSKAGSLLGRVVSSGDTVYVRPQSAVANDPLKNVIRAVRAATNGVDEKLVACGRDRILDLAVDDKSVAWTEPGKGVFLAPR